MSRFGFNWTKGFWRVALLVSIAIPIVGISLSFTSDDFVDNPISTIFTKLLPALILGSIFYFAIIIGAAWCIKKLIVWLWSGFKQPPESGEDKSE